MDLCNELAVLPRLRVQPVCKLASPARLHVCTPARLRRHLVYLTPGTREHSAGW